VYTFEDYKVDLREPDVTRVGVPPSVEAGIRYLAWLGFRIMDPSKVAYNLADVALCAVSCVKLNPLIRRFQPDVLIMPDHGCPGLLIGKPKNCRVILISHHNPARFLNNPLWGLHSECDARWTIMVENKVLRKVDAVVCPSQYMREIFRKTYEYSGALTVVPNMVDPEVMASVPVHDIRANLGLRGDSVLVYIPSAGNVYKGSRYVFEIICRLSAYTPENIGFYLSGSLDSQLQHELRSAPPNARIHTPGHLGYHDNLAIVKACSFGISPTLIENFGMALLEANFCGVPMVTFNVGGNAEFISDGKSGFLVPYLDLEALLHAAYRLMDKNCLSDIRRETVRCASKFSSDVLIEQFMSVLN
jgi:glycosyltransferase involved in cell wall biosynthesis